MAAAVGAQRDSAIAGLGNAAMGLVFGYTWRRTGRLWPLVIAHGVIDTVAFVGYLLLASHLSWLT
ncbi:hypothetical protein A5662_04295 [Mycobacteriaceae bacterium 1482268.1]|nr:hypothetical protein A5662_04295 [Mycobacteriaceae bacterium 1482268.1]